MVSNLLVARALSEAHRERFTGTLKITSAGRPGALRLHEGDVVDVEAAGFAHQTAAQALLMQGRLPLRTLDALWARGSAAATDEDFLEDAGLAPDELVEAQRLARIRILSEQAEKVEWEDGTVEPRFRLDGAEVVRALGGPAAEHA